MSVLGVSQGRSNSVNMRYTGEACILHVWHVTESWVQHRDLGVRVQRSGMVPASLSWVGHMGAAAV